jgi:transcriptional regulator with XRE-family HTH domain
MVLSVMAEVGENLKRLRAAAGLTQQQLAVAAGLSVSVVAHIERGHIPDPRASTLRALARSLGCTLDDLAGDEPPLRRKRGGE